MSQTLDLQIPEKMLPLWQAPRSRYEHVALYSGRGGSKSHGTAEWVIAQCGQRKERVVCGREFQNSIDESVKTLLVEKIHKLGVRHLWTVKDRELEHRITKSRITFIGMNRNPDSAKSLEGCTIFWGEEAQTFSKRSMEVIMPTVVRTKNSIMIWTWNPRDADDPVDLMFRGPMKHRPPHCLVIEMSFKDNPYFYNSRLPSEERRMRRADPERHKHVWGGGYDENPSAAVFKSFEVKRIAVPEKCRPLFGGDFGFSVDPYAFVKLYIIEEWDCIYIRQEAYGWQVPNKHVKDLADTITEINDFQVTGDSSRPETIEMLQGEGLPIYGARKGAGSVKAGLNFLGGYHIIIDPDCPLIAEEIRKYRWSVDKADRVLPFPENYQDDHGIDAARYAVEEYSINLPDENDTGVDEL